MFKVIALTTDWSLLDSFILEKVRETKLPSLAIGVVDKNGEFIYSRVIGFRDVERGLPATLNTNYGIGSVTKSFTALCVVKLSFEGLIDLEDSVVKYIPEFNVKPFGRDIRVKDLLTHTTGLPALGYAEAFIRSVLELDTAWLPISKPEDIILFMNNSSEWAVSKPGEKFYYLNEGYVLLGYIVSKVTGMSYEDYVRKTILKPLNMNKTYFSEEDFRKDFDTAVPYLIDKNGNLVKTKFPFGVTADGGLISNVNDMSKYLTMLINRGVFNNSIVLSEEVVKTVEEKRVDYPYKLFGDESYGYGWMITEKFYDRKLVSHSGSILVHTAYAGYLPRDGYGVVVLANSSGYPLSIIGLYALSIALGYNPEKELKPVFYDRMMSKLVGIYETYKGTFHLSIERNGDFLTLVYRDKYTESKTTLVPVEIKEDYCEFYTLSNTRRIPVEFYIEKERIIMIYERYKFVKKR